MFTVADKRKDLADALTPPQWKTMIASALAIYPLVYFILPVLRPHTDKLPQWLGSLATASAIQARCLECVAAGPVRVGQADLKLVELLLARLWG